MANARDRQIVRDLARQVAEIAHRPEQEVRRQTWLRANRLERGKPPVFVSPEGAWVELLPEADLECEDEALRAWEHGLRVRIYAWEHFRDDQVTDADFRVPYAVTMTGWGLEPNRIYSDVERGAFRWEAPIKGPGDLPKLSAPRAVHDAQATQRHLERAQEILGDILNVYLHGGCWWSFGLIGELAYLRGLEEIMIDMATDPDFVHRAMGIITDARLEWLDSLEQQGLLCTNHRNDYVGSGGFGFTDELPADDFDGRHVRPVDMWGFAEAQEISGVSPAMHDEFVLQYQMRALERFGLNCYGCCEPLHHKFDIVLKIPRLRRISISPWCDMAITAEALQDKYIFSWKPNPTDVMVGAFNEERIRRIIRDAFDIARDCIVEIILKDTHTCQGEPWRFTRWTEIAQEEARRLADARG